VHDATHLTNFSGDGKVHPGYISSAQIHSSDRSKVNLRPFLLLFYLPVCKFAKTEFTSATQQKQMPGRLQARLTHLCLKKVFEPFESAGRQAVDIVNSKGELRKERMFLGLYIADKEEQNMLAALGANSCTICLAETNELGDANCLEVS
jgi:hypothetical protein